MTSTPMVETIARAICKSRTCEGMHCCQWPAQGGRTQCPVRSGAYDDAARAALSALSTPTEGMVEAGCLAIADHHDGSPWAHKQTARDCLAAMIQSALNEGKA